MLIDPGRGARHQRLAIWSRIPTPPATLVLRSTTLLVTAVAICVIAGCTDPRSKPADTDVSTAPVDTGTNASHANASQPDGVEFTIEGQDVTPGKKASVDVRLPRKVSEQELRRIAHQVRNRLPRDLERVFIVYRLPGMKRDRGAWATTHFNPGLEVKILGMDPETAKRLNRTDTKASRGELIGSWVINSAAMPGRVDIYATKKGFLLYQQLVFGGRSEDLEQKLVEVPDRRGRRFEPAGTNAHGEYFLVLPRGGLWVGSRNGVFAKGSPRR